MDFIARLVEYLLEEVGQIDWTRIERDRAGRCYIKEIDRCPKCREIRSPSRAYPFSQARHSATAFHLACRWLRENGFPIHYADEAVRAYRSAVRRAVSRKEWKQGWKVTLEGENGLESIYDPEFKYKIGETHKKVYVFRGDIPSDWRDKSIVYFVSTQVPDEVFDRLWKFYRQGRAYLITGRYRTVLKVNSVSRGPHPLEKIKVSVFIPETSRRLEVSD